MPRLLIKTKDRSIIEKLKYRKKPGYDLVVVSSEETFAGLSKKDKDVHGIFVDQDMITPAEIISLKERMDDPVFPVILFAQDLTDEEAGRWIGAGVSDIFQLSIPAPLMGRRITSIIQLYRVNRSLHGQVTDRLTGLYKRNAFYHFAREMINRYPTDHYMIILSDIENFKRINERFGEEKGDALLRFVGQSLNKMNGEYALFSRYGGDQFVGIIRYPEPFQDMNENILEGAMQRFYADAPIEQFNVQFGIYEDVDKTLPISIMCDRALMALKTIKHQYGRNLAKYTLQLQEKFNREQQILDSMEKAISEQQFQVYYQPKHDIVTSKLVGAEALVRWNHPVYGFMSPGEFIPLFEKSGFISQMDAYVWKRVCQDVQTMINRGIPVVPISINASRRDLMTEKFVSVIKEPLEKMQLDPALFHLEITESVYMEDAELVSPLLNQLRQIGIQTELDDFGSGYSSLGILSQLPVDVIKLDISLIKNLETQPAIVESIIHLMHILGYKVTAEGVEYDSQVDQLKKMHCDYVQGYYYSKPLTFDGFCEYSK